MAFLGNLLAAGMSSGLIPNLLKGAGDVVGDIVGGLQRGEKLSPGLIAGALGRGATSTLGRVLAPKPQDEQPIRIMAPVGSSAANARPVYVPSSSGGDRVVMQPLAPSPAALPTLGGPEPPLPKYGEDEYENDAMAEADRNGAGGAWLRGLSDVKLAKYALKYRNSKDNARYVRSDDADNILNEERGVTAAQVMARHEAEEKKPKKYRNYYPKGEAPAKRMR